MAKYGLSNNGEKMLDHVKEEIRTKVKAVSGDSILIRNGGNILIGFAYSPRHILSKEEYLVRIERAFGAINKIFPADETKINPYSLFHYSEDIPGYQKKIVYVVEPMEVSFPIRRDSDPETVIDLIHSEAYDRKDWSKEGTIESYRRETVTLLPFSKITDVYLDILIGLDNAPETLEQLEIQKNYHGMPVIPPEMLEDGEPDISKGSCCV